MSSSIPPFSIRDSKEIHLSFATGISIILQFRGEISDGKIFYQGGCFQYSTQKRAFVEDTRFAQQNCAA